jgi:hypothetical protein
MAKKKTVRIAPRDANQAAFDVVQRIIKQTEASAPKTKKKP